MRWKLKSPPDSSVDELKLNQTSQAICPPLISQLLNLRGLTQAQAIDRFLHPDYDRDLHDPFLFKDMSKAVDRIYQAIDNNESVVIFGDYDADGVPAAAIIAQVFDWLGFTNYQVYIPDRYTEQYGLSAATIDQFVKNGVSLMITVDCGITDVAEVTQAISGGLEVIITDHHLTPPDLPPAVAIINPKRQDDTYPDPNLSGAGVAFKLAQAMSLTGRQPKVLPPGRVKWLLDLVAIATVADMMPLTGENRTLVYFGLIVLRQARRPGLRALLKKLKIKPATVNESDIGFMIGPRLNAASRLAHADEAYALLTAKNARAADHLARGLDERNQGRRSLVEKILTSAEVKQAAEQNQAVMVVGRPDFSIGVLGLAASRLTEQFKRPVFVWTVNGQGEIKGSCRSSGEINIVNLMSATGRDFFSDFGGHAQAGGFSLPLGTETKLADKLNQAYSTMPKEDLDRDIYYEAELKLDEVTEDLWRWLEQLSPFGLANPAPVFLFRQVKVVSIKNFGAAGEHLELIIGDRGIQLPAINFFRSQPSWLNAGSAVDILATVEKSFWRGANLRLRLVDLRPAIN